MISSQKQHGTICSIHEVPKKDGLSSRLLKWTQRRGEALLSRERTDNWPLGSKSLAERGLVSGGSTFLGPGPLEPGCLPESPLALRLPGLCTDHPPLQEPRTVATRWGGPQALLSTLTLCPPFPSSTLRGSSPPLCSVDLQLSKLLWAGNLSSRTRDIPATGETNSARGPRLCGFKRRSSQTSHVWNLRRDASELSY